MIPYFWRLFWPLLLIMIGLLMLAERAALAAEGYAPFFGATYAGVGQATGQGGPPTAGQGAEPAGTAIGLSQPHDFENGVNGGQR